MSLRRNVTVGPRIPMHPNPYTIQHSAIAVGKFSLDRQCDVIDTSLPPIYRPIQPPSTTIVSPLTYPLARDARNTTAPSKSSGLPHFPAGIRSRICRDLVGLARRAVFMSVSMYPGAMAFTLMPFDAHSLDSAFVRPATPCLAAAYAGTVRPPEIKCQLMLR
jgi:hypothetical protein